jgi:hypothetical protein
MKSSKAEFAICVRNNDHPASLELRKLYQVVPDAPAARRGLLRIVDESGEDYLYPERYFVAVRLGDAVRRAVARAVHGEGGEMVRASRTG